ncbi:hypothetical protein AAFF_G00379860, partial [Aldrovandia affinis]
ERGVLTLCTRCCVMGPLWRRQASPALAARPRPDSQHGTRGGNSLSLRMSRWSQRMELLKRLKFTPFTLM